MFNTRQIYQVQTARPQPVPPEKAVQQKTTSGSHGGMKREHIYGSEHRKDFGKNEERVMEKNGRGTPREYNDVSEHRKGNEYRNDLGTYEEQIQELNRELKRSKSVAAEQSRLIEEKERMIQDLTTRYDTFTYKCSVYPCKRVRAFIICFTH